MKPFIKKFTTQKVESGGGPPGIVVKIREFDDSLSNFKKLEDSDRSVTIDTVDPPLPSARSFVSTEDLT